MIERRASALPLADPAGQRRGLGEVVEADLDRHLLAPRPHLDLMAEGRFEPVGYVAHRRLFLRVPRSVRALARAWLASQLGPSLGLPHRPALRRRAARQLAAGIVAADLQHRSSVALAQLARFEQLEDVVGKVEEPDEVRDRRPAAADPPPQLLLR